MLEPKSRRELSVGTRLALVAFSVPAFLALGYGLIRLVLNGPFVAVVFLAWILAVFIVLDIGILRGGNRGNLLVYSALLLMGILILVVAAYGIVSRLTGIDPELAQENPALWIALAFGGIVTTVLSRSELVRGHR